MGKKTILAKIPVLQSFVCMTSLVGLLRRKVSMLNKFRVCVVAVLFSEGVLMILAKNIKPSS